MKSYYEGNSKKSGIYKIINIINGRIYIGSTKEFKARHRQHLTSLKNNKHQNKFLQADFNKCGEDAFEFHVLEAIEGEQSQRLLVEQTYIDKYFDKQDTCYNFKPNAKADSRSCFSKDPEKTRKLLSNATKELWKNSEYVEKRISSMKIVAATPEFKEKQRQTTQEYWDSHPEKKEELAIRSSKYNKEHPEVIEQLKANQPKGRETFKKRMKEDVELKAKYQEIAKEKANKLNQRYKNDPEYKKKMDELSSKNLKAFNDKKNSNLSIKGSLIDPNGIVFENIKNVSEFSRQHNLDPSHLMKLFNGKLKSVKGWKKVSS